jgi:dynein heavy chain
MLFSTVLALLPRSVNTSGMTRDEVLLATCAMIAKKTPPLFDLEYIRKTYPTTYSECMNTVLLQEAIRYNKLLERMHQSLRDLQKGIKGEMVMTESLESMADSLFNNLVPVFWEAVAYPSLMPLAAWTDDLIARITFINNWVASGVPVVFWISGFFFPQAFLTGTLQNFARKTRQPIDAISFGFHVHDRPHDQISVKPDDGVYIHGLFLEGARWDPVEGSIVDSRPKELFTPMPVMLLLPEIERVVPESGVYKCPVYKILTRRGTLSTTGHSTNFVLYLEIPTTVSQKKWIKAGVALFCALRY